MIIDKGGFNKSILEVATMTDIDGEIEISIHGGGLDDRSVWINRNDIKELIKALVELL